MLLAANPKSATESSAEYLIKACAADSGASTAAGCKSKEDAGRCETRTDAR